MERVDVVADREVDDVPPAVPADEVVALLHGTASPIDALVRDHVVRIQVVVASVDPVTGRTGRDGGGLRSGND